MYETGFAIGLALLAIVVVAMLVRRGRRPKVGRRTAVPESFHGVAIRVDPITACEPARALVGRRFLTKDAPLLPLRGCDSANCTCKYEHHDDRRGGERRDNTRYVQLSVNSDGYERRYRRGRRRDDLIRLDDYALRAAVLEKRRQRREQEKRKVH
jgi:hypothetical protein